MCYKIVERGYKDGHDTYARSDRDIFTFSRIISGRWIDLTYSFVRGGGGQVVLYLSSSILAQFESTACECVSQLSSSEDRHVQ